MSLESERVGLVHELCFHAGSERGGFAARWNLNENSKDQRLVDYGLADVENAYVEVRKNACELGGETRSIGPGEVNEDGLRSGSG